MKCAIGLPAKDTLERNISELLTRPVGCPSYKLVVRFYNKRATTEQWG